MQSSKIIPDEHIATIFGKLDLIKEKTKDILNTLLKKVDDNTNLISENQKLQFLESSKVGMIFKENIYPILKVFYVPYLNSYTESLSKLEKLFKKFPEFKNFIEVNSFSHTFFENLINTLFFHLENKFGI